MSYLKLIKLLYLAIREVEQLDEFEVAHASAAQAQQMSRGLRGFSLVETNATAHVYTISGTALDRKSHAGVTQDLRGELGGDVFVFESAHLALLENALDRPA